jgi:spore coat polysaccharide biosynthesis protein SpsF (cytidylyltransferase family)
MIKVLIGIQARSTSHRLPGKSLAMLHNKPVLSWVLTSCEKSAKYINTHSNDRLLVDVALLVPQKDEILSNYSKFNIFEGDEDDVLSRYVETAEFYNSDYIVRITGDCPFLTSFMITNHIFKATGGGRDIEVLSRKALKWLEVNAVTKEEREHVTTKIRKERPRNLRRGHFLNRMDLSPIKTSIDTSEDLEIARRRMMSFYSKKELAERDVGRHNVFFA